MRAIINSIGPKKWSKGRFGGRYGGLGRRARMGIGARFSVVGGVSNDMLVSLSLSHLDSKTFGSNTEMVDFLSENALISFKETLATMKELDRKNFILEDENKEDSEVYSLSASKFSEGVDVTNPIMQAILLDTTLASLKARATESSEEPSKGVKVLDVGCATGYLSLGIGQIIKKGILAENENFGNYEVNGIDIDEGAVEKAREVAEDIYSGILVGGRVNFYQDDFFRHLSSVKDYDVIVSGCGMTHGDIIGSVFTQLDSSKDIVIIAPVFTSAQQQSLRVIFPESLSSGMLAELSKVKIFDQIVISELGDGICFVDLFTCFFTPLSYPGTSGAREGSEHGEELNLNLEGIVKDHESRRAPKKPADFKKLNLGEIVELLEAREGEFKEEFLRLKEEAKASKLSLAEVKNNPGLKNLLKEINLLKRFKHVRENPEEEKTKK